MNTQNASLMSSVHTSALRALPSLAELCIPARTPPTHTHTLSEEAEISSLPSLVSPLTPPLHFSLPKTIPPVLAGVQTPPCAHTCKREDRSRADSSALTRVGNQNVALEVFFLTFITHSFRDQHQPHGDFSWFRGRAQQKRVMSQI